MNPEQFDWMWLDESAAVDMPALSQASGMSAAELIELVEYGALQPLDPARPERLFSAQCVSPLRTAGRLRADFDLDLFAVAVLLDYMNRIEVLEHQVRTLQARTGATQFA